MENEAAPRRILGLRAAALAEIVFALAAALAADAAFGSGGRLAWIQPHPFWIVVLLASAYYGAAEGLLAAALASAALLAGNMPEPAIGEDLTAWLLRATALPVMWFVAALVIGGIRSGQRREVDSLRHDLRRAQAQAATIADAHDRLADLKGALEERVAAHGLTLRRVAEASRSLGRPSLEEVLAAAPDFAGAVLPATRVAVFRTQGDALVPAGTAGYGPDDPRPRRIEAGPLCEAVLKRRDVLCVADPAQEALLDGRALVAAPLVGPESGIVHGMLALDGIAFRDLTPATLFDARAAAGWIGRSLERAAALDTPAAIPDRAAPLRATG